MRPLNVLAPFVGAIAIGVVIWYQLRKRLGQSGTQQVLRSVGYWVITALMVLVSGFGALILFPDAAAPRLFLAGAAFPVLLKKLVATFVTDTAVKLGADSAERHPVRGYFDAIG
jgi:hypothetical protein